MQCQAPASTAPAAHHASSETTASQETVAMQLINGSTADSRFLNAAHEPLASMKQCTSRSNLVQLTAVAAGAGTLSSASPNAATEGAPMMPPAAGHNRHEQLPGSCCSESGAADVQLQDTCAGAADRSTAAAAASGNTAVLGTCNCSCSSTSSNVPAASEPPVHGSAAALKDSKSSKASNTKATSAASSSNKASSNSSSTGGRKSGPMSATTAAASTALAAAKLGLSEQMSSALAVAPAAATMRDVEGRCCLHYAAGYGHEECVDVLLAKGGSEVLKARDVNGDLPLHLAAQQGHPMCAYNIAKACPASCLVKNKRGQCPIDVAAAAARGEVLNALLLACAGEGRSAVAVAAMRALLAAGAVPDTWAPNGSSALMLAAAADGVTALQVLLEGGATIELQDALGRSALMFAAGNGATAACQVLLDNNASLSARDRRGRAALDYAAAGSDTAKLLQKRLTELETVANKLQQQLLSEGQQGTQKQAASSGSSSTAPAGIGSRSSSAKSSSKKKKKKKANKAVAAAPAAEDSADDIVSAAAGHADSTSSTSPESCADCGEDEAPALPPGNCTAGKHAVACPSATAAACEGSETNVIQRGALSITKQGGSSTDGAPVADEAVTAASSTYAELVAATVAGAAVCDAAAQAHDGDWQVVVPKSKQRVGQCGSSGESCSGKGAAAAARSSKAAARQPDSCPNTKQQQQQQQTQTLELAAAASSSKRLSQQQQQHSAKQQQQQHSSAGCCIASCSGHSGHRRQESSHSLCSTISIASYDSSSSSSVSPAAAATATSNSGPNSCCSCVSCCSHHTLPQHAVQPTTCMQGGSRSSSTCGTPTAAAVATLGGSRQQQKQIGMPPTPPPSVSSANVATKLANTSMPLGVRVPVKEAAAVPAAGVGVGAACGGGDTASKDSSRASTPSAAAAAAAGFKAAVLGLTSTNAGCSIDVSLQQQQQQQCDRQACLSTSTQSAVSDGVASVGAEALKGCNSRPTAQQPQQQQQQKQLQEELQKAQARIDQLEQASASLSFQLKQQAFAHQQQLAAVLEDAATHEAAAVAAAAEAAVAETLQSPLVRQLLQAAAQQAVATERTRMQLKLQAMGLPPAYAVQLLLGPVQGAAAPAAALLAAAAANAAAMGAEGTATAPVAAAAGKRGAAATGSAVQPLIDAILSGCTDPTNTTGNGGRCSNGAAVAGAAVQPPQQQQQHRSSEVNAAEPQLPELNLDLRSEYCGGSSSFVAPAKQRPRQCGTQPCSATAAARDVQSTCMGGTAAGATSQRGLAGDISVRRSYNGTAAARYSSGTLAGGAAAAPVAALDAGGATEPDWRRISTDSLFAGATSAIGGATRSSSSDSLSMSITDDAEVEETRIGSFGAIGGPPSTPPSSFCNSRLTCSPAVASMWASGGLVASRGTAFSTRPGTSFGTSPLWSGPRGVQSGARCSSRPASATSRLADSCTVAEGKAGKGCGDASNGVAADVLDLLPDDL